MWYCNTKIPINHYTDWYVIINEFFGFQTSYSQCVYVLRKELSDLASLLREAPADVDWEVLTEANIKAIKDKIVQVRQCLLSKTETTLNSNHSKHICTLSVLQLEEMKAQRIASGKELLQRIYHLCRRVALKSELLDANPALESQLFDLEVLQQVGKLSFINPTN